MADIAAEIEAKKAYRKALAKVRAMRRRDEHRGDPRMARAARAAAAAPLAARAISKTRIVRRIDRKSRDPSPLAIGRQFSEEVCRRT